MLGKIPKYEILSYNISIHLLCYCSYTFCLKAIELDKKNVLSEFRHFELNVSALSGERIHFRK